MKKIALLIVACIICLNVFVGCESKEEKECISQGIELLDKDNYVDALAKFNDGLKINPKNSKLNDLKSMTDNFIKAKTSYDNHNFQESDKHLKEIKNKYNTYSVGKDIDELKVKVKNMTDLKSTLDTSIEKLKVLQVGSYQFKLTNNDKYIKWYSDGEPMDITHLAVGIDTSKYPYNVKLVLEYKKDLEVEDAALKEALEILTIDKSMDIYNALIKGINDVHDSDTKFKSGNNEVNLMWAQGGLVANINIYAEESEVDAVIDAYNKEQQKLKEEEEKKLQEEIKAINEKLAKIDEYILAGDISYAGALINEIESTTIPDALKANLDSIKSKFETKRDEINKQINSGNILSEDEAINLVAAIAITDEHSNAVKANGGKIALRIEERIENNMSGYWVGLGESYTDRMVIVRHYFVDKATKKIYLLDVAKNEWTLVQ